MELLRYSEAEIPTVHGPFRIIVYREARERATCADPICSREHMALVRGHIDGKPNVLARVHSECWTSEVMGSLKCDCREQLHTAMERIAAEGAGVVVYLRQEGRGIGLGK
jgi:GTP cyclohydrolase II